MASRIKPKCSDMSYFDKHRGRCGKMSKLPWSEGTIRVRVNDADFHPIIAKGNRFDGVTAWW